MNNMNNQTVRRYLNDLEDISEFVLQDDSNGKGVYIKEWYSINPKPTKAQLDIIQNTLEVEENATKYQRDRIAKYPSVGDQLDALWKGGTDATAMKTIIDGIKTKYPKPIK